MASKFNSFEEWKSALDSYLEGKVGLSSDDLPDYCYRDAYDDGESPYATARAAIRAAREF